MGQYKYLLKNIGVLTLSSFVTKILNFLLVPLYTNILSTTEYGTFDLFTTTVALMVPILTINIQEAVFRFVMDQSFDKEAIATVSFKYFIISNFFVLFILLLNHCFCIISIIKEYWIFFFLIYFSQSLSGIVSMYTRGAEKIKDISIASIIGSAVIICTNVMFLLIFGWGLIGYFCSYIIGIMSQCAYLIFRSKIYNNIKIKKRFDAEKKEMISYCRPMIANSIAWWVNSVSDRYIIIFFVGLSENGIYSVASKIPSILNIIQSIFSQAWTLSAVKEFDPEDKNGFFAGTYAIYNCLMVIFCSFLILLDKILAKFLYANEFYSAWKYSPWLTIAIVFGSLSGYLGGFFSAVKNSKIFAKSTIVGALSNIVLNLISVPFIGPLGAAIATAVCYVVVWAIRLINSKKYIKMKINLLRDVISYIVMIVQSVILLILENDLLLYLIEFILFMFIVLLYINDIIRMIKKGGSVLKCSVNKN